MRLRVARHPLPDARGLAAAAEVEALARGLDGGRPAAGAALRRRLGAAAGARPRHHARGQGAVTSLLLRSGATIRELNTVRKHLSRLKGGGLARGRRAGARGVPRALRRGGRRPLDDRLGPDRARPHHLRRRARVLRERGVLGATPRAVREHLEAGAPRRGGGDAQAGRPLFRRVSTRVVGSNRWTSRRRRSEARRLGLRPLVLTTRLEGEAREAARAGGDPARVRGDRPPAATPVCLLAGGETTVTVRGDGVGGRNQELAVAAAEAAGRASRTRGGREPGHRRHRRRERRGRRRGRPRHGRGARARLGLAPPAAFLAASDSRASWARWAT